MRGSLICLMSSLILLKNAFAFEVCGDFKQGELIIVKDNNDISLFALRRDEPSPYKIKNIEFEIEKTKWDIQSIKGVEQKKVTPSKQDEKEILREQKDVRDALSIKGDDLLNFTTDFILPVDGIISGNFGNQRIFNGVPKNPHTGTDIAAPLGTPVKASGKGKVLLAGGNYFYSGNMVILDHGKGLKTIYAHLKDVNVKKGDIVNQGDIIGSVGQTGRATGPHLHFGASLNNVRFRPHSLLDITSKSCRSF